MYYPLLYSAGGGIISQVQQAEQDATCATIAIGLGGTGCDCLRTLKKAVYERVRPDPGKDNDLISRFHHIGFLAVDTDPSGFGVARTIDEIDTASEFFDISDSHIKGLIENRNVLMSNNPTMRWLSTGMTPTTAASGAGGYRQIGRLLLMRNCTQFYTKLTNVIQKAKTTDVNETPITDVNVHIFTGISGGTGAGTFLDVCYIVQHALSSLGIGGANICGYFFLPDVNMQKSDDKYLKANGYASLKELDYCMNFANNGGRWKQDYPGFQIDTKEPPVTLAHLVSAQGADGNSLTNGYEYAMHVVTDYVLEYITKPSIPANTDTSQPGSFTIKSHISNVDSHVSGVMKEHGGCYNYCVLGAACQYVPYRDIMTYLTSKIMEGYTSTLENAPSQAEVTDFAASANVGIDLNSVMTVLTEKMGGVARPDIKPKDLFTTVSAQVRDPLTLPGLFSMMDNSYNQLVGRVTANKMALLGAADGTQNNVVALRAKVKNTLSAMAYDISHNKGPSYAAAMINGPGYNLMSLIAGIVKTCDEQIQTEKDRFAFVCDNTIPQAFAAFKNSNFVNRNKAAENYTNAWMAYYQQKVAILKWESLRQVYEGFVDTSGRTIEGLKDQLTGLYRYFFSVFNNVASELYQTFNQNLQDLMTGYSVNNYAVPVVQISDKDLRDSLDASVRAMNPTKQVEDFLNVLEKDEDAWLSNDSNKISAKVREHFSNVLNVYANKTFIDYLKSKYQTEDPTALQSQIYNNIMVPIGQKATPKFWVNNADYDFTGTSRPMGYLSIPQGMQAIQMAASQYITANSANHVASRETFSTARITLFSFRCGIPMFAYMGEKQYYAAYKEDNRPGKHLYEGTEYDPRDFRNLPEPHPFTSVDPSKWTENDKKRSDLYDKATNEGFIDFALNGTQRDYTFKMFAGAKEWIEEAEKLLSSDAKSGDDAKKLMKQLESAKNKVPANIPATGTFLSISEVDSNLPQKLKDTVLGSLEFTQFLEGQLDMAHKMDELKTALQKKQGEQMGQLVQKFAKALFSGVLTSTDTNHYTWTFVSRLQGWDDEKTLTNPDTEPYGVDAVLYSAFIGYSDLDDAIQEEIDAAAKSARVNGNHDEMRAYVESMADRELGKRLVSILEGLKTSHPESFADIQQFYNRLRTEKTGFVNSL